MVSASVPINIMGTPAEKVGFPRKEEKYLFLNFKRKGEKTSSLMKDKHTDCPLAGWNVVLNDSC